MGLDATDDAPMELAERNYHSVTVDTADDVIVDIVTAIADREGVDPLALPPLYTVANLDDVEALVSGAAWNSTDHVRIRYLGYDVTISRDGSMAVHSAIEES